MAFLQLATEVSEPFVIKGFSPVTPTSSRKNSLEEQSHKEQSSQQEQQQQQIGRTRNNSLSLL